MNNKKLSRLLEPNLKLYFFCMVIFAAAAMHGEPAPGPGGAGLRRGAVRLFHQAQPDAPAEHPAVYRLRHRQRGHRQQVHPHQLPAAHHGVPAGHRRGHLEQRELPPAGRRAGAPVRDEGGGRGAGLPGPVAAGGEERVPGPGGDEQPPVPGLRQPGAGQGPERRAEPGGHHLLGGHHRGRRAEGAVHRHPARAGHCDGGQLRGPDEGLRRHGRAAPCWPRSTRS